MAGQFVAVVAVALAVTIVADGLPHGVDNIKAHLDQVKWDIQHAKHLDKSVKQAQIRNVQSLEQDLTDIRSSKSTVTRKKLSEAIKLRQESLAELLHSMHGNEQQVEAHKSVHTSGSYKAHKSHTTAQLNKPSAPDHIVKHAAPVHQDAKDHLQHAANLVKNLQNQFGDKLVGDDKENVESLMMDLELLESSNDTEETADLVKAISLRLPAVKAIADHMANIKAPAADSKAPAADSKAPAADSKTPAADSKAHVVPLAKVDENMATSEVTPAQSQKKDSEVESKTTDKYALGLEQIHALQKVLQSAQIPEEKRTHYMNNLGGLEKDVKAVHDESLTDDQRSDLESAMKLRLTMLGDMETFLANT